MTTTGRVVRAGAGQIAALAAAAVATLSVVPAGSAVPAPEPVRVEVPVAVPADAEVVPAPEPVPPVDADLAPVPDGVPSRVQLALAVAGHDVPARQAVREAVARVGAVSLLAGGPRVSGRTLVPVAEELGVAVGGRLLAEPWITRSRRAAVAATPLFAAAGLEQPRPVRVDDLRRAFEAYGLDPGGVVDPGDVERLRDAVRNDLGELRVAAGTDDDPATPKGLGALLTALGVDYGTRVDAADVAEGRATAATVLLAAAERAAAEAAAAEAAAAEAAARAATPPAPKPAPSAEPTPSPAAEPPPPPPPPAWRPVHGSLVHRTFELPGPVRVQVLRWRLDDPALRLRADYAVGPDRKGTVPEAAARTGAVAAINGGFWVGENDPDGLLVRDGFLLSDTTANMDGHRNIRSAFGLRGGRGIVGVPTWNGYVTLGDTTLGIHGVNRRSYEPGQVLVATPGAGADPIGARAGTALRVPRVDLNRAGTHELKVLERREGGSLPVTDDTMVVWVAPEAMSVPAKLGRLTLKVNVAEAWQGTETALAAGPWLLTQGEGVGVGQWRHEGFDSAHTDTRHPRSAIGFTGDGHGVIVAIDGRRPGRSEGMTHTEVARFLQGLGVRDAVMLDGGGSSQMVVQGQVANEPCCDQPLRRVSTVVTLLPR